jgi:amino acid transporter
VSQEEAIPTEPAKLKRSLGLTLLSLYGIGTTIGAGIFALVGKVAGRAGVLAPLSFLVAALLAALSAFSFAELASRLPRAAGEAAYVEEGLRSRRLARGIGLLVVAAGVISASAMARATVGYIGEFVEPPAALAIAGVIVTLGALAIWGITESVAVAALLTLVETGGLLLVIATGLDTLEQLPARLEAAALSWEPAVVGGVMTGAFLAFYAFLGFEDMVNVAEEVKDVRRNMPRGIAITLIATSSIYVVLALVAVAAMAPSELAASDAPLADLYRQNTGRGPALISAISIFAILNGALVQVIMAARILYGLADRGLLPRSVARVHPRTRTPYVATLGVTAVVLVLALGFPIEGLAATTSGITLVVFAAVNLALWRLKGREPAPAGVFRIPRWVPVVGFGVSVGFLAVALALWFAS